MKPSKLLLIQVDSDGTTFYHCKFCDYRSKNHTNAKVHQRIHSNERPHVCDFCPYASNSASNLKKHLLQHSDVSFTCAHCPYASKSKQYLKKHMRSHLNAFTNVHPKSERPAAVTVLCDDASTSDIHNIDNNDSSAINSNNNIANNSHSNSSSNESSTNNSNNNNNDNNNSGGRGIKKSSKYNSINNNNSNVYTGNNSHVVDIFWCPLCQMYELPQHVEEHLRCSRHVSMLSKFPHRCTRCEAGFFERTSLEIHNELAHNAAGETAAASGKSYHEQLQHFHHSHYHNPAKRSSGTASPSGSSKLHCNTCEYSTASAILLDAHQSVVHEGRPKFTCGWCAQEFLLEASQREHVLQRLLLQTVERRSRLTCSFCLKAFQHKDVVRKHEAEEHSVISSAERIRCCVCLRVFRTKKSHREHFCRKPCLDEPPLHCSAQRAYSVDGSVGSVTSGSRMAL